MGTHFILDFETLGTSVFTAPVVSIACYMFDWDRFTSKYPYTFNELIKEIRFSKFDVQKQMDKFGYKPEKSTVKWWLDQGDEARKLITPHKTDIEYDTFLDNLHGYLGNTKIDFWWSRSNAFDPLFLERIHRDCGRLDYMSEKLRYWKVRDIRTYIDTVFAFKNKRNDFIPIDDETTWNAHFVKHNPIHDVAADILRLQKLERLTFIEE